jgi:hypothetical protein
MRPGPPPSLLLLCTLPTALDAPEPTHSPLQPRRHPPSTPPEAAVPGVTFERRQDPRTGHLLVTLLPASRGYKNPRRLLPEDAHTTATKPRSSLFLSPSEMSDLCTGAPPRSGGFRPPLELLLVRGGGAEPPLLICITAVKLCILSVTPSPSNTRHCNAGEPLVCPGVDDDDAPLDLDPTEAYRFGILIRSDEWTPSVRLGFKTFPPRAKRYRAGLFGILLDSARLVRSRSVSFFIYSPAFSN